MRQVECRHKAGFGAAGLGTAQSWFWSRHKAGFWAVGLESAQSRFWSRHKASLGAAGYKTGLVSRQVLHLLSKLQNWICPKTGQYKTCILSNTKIIRLYIGLYIYMGVYTYIYSLYIYSLYIIYIYTIYTLYIHYIYTTYIHKHPYIYTHIYIYNLIILVFDTMQVCIDPFWDKSSFVASIEDAKPVLILNRFCNLPHPNWLCACSKTSFVPILNQPLQNRLCACSKTGFVPSLNLLHQNRLFAYAHPAAPKPALHQH